MEEVLKSIESFSMENGGVLEVKGTEFSWRLNSVGFLWSRI